MTEGANRLVEPPGPRQAFSNSYSVQSRLPRPAHRSLASTHVAERIGDSPGSLGYSYLSMQKDFMLMRCATSFAPGFTFFSSLGPYSAGPAGIFA